MAPSARTRRTGRPGRPHCAGGAARDLRGGCPDGATTWRRCAGCATGCTRSSWPPTRPTAVRAGQRPGRRRPDHAAADRPRRLAAAHPLLRAGRPAGRAPGRRLRHGAGLRASRRASGTGWPSAPPPTASGCWSTCRATGPSATATAAPAATGCTSPPTAPARRPADPARHAADAVTHAAGKSPTRVVTTLRDHFGVRAAARRGVGAVEHRDPDADLAGGLLGDLVARVGVPQHPRAGVVGEHPGDLVVRRVGALGDDHHAGVDRLADADAAAVVHRHPGGAGRGVEQRVEDRPVGDRVGAVAHPLGLPLRARRPSRRRGGRGRSRSAPRPRRERPGRRTPARPRAARRSRASRSATAAPGP